MPAPDRRLTGNCTSKRRRVLPLPGRARQGTAGARPGLSVPAAVISMLLLSGIPAHADVNSELNRFWNDLGGTSNFTGPQTFQGQAAGYYTGGSLRVRSGTRTTQLGTLQLPSVEAGCGGIDIFSGSLSIISKEELKQLTNAIVRNGIGFAFDLALETLSPVIAETMKDLRAKLQALTQANINSCETAEALVMGMWPKSQRASSAICARIGARTGRFTDYAASRHGCGKTADYDATQSSASAAEKQQWPDKINVAWDALRGDHLSSSDWLRSDDDMAEVLMSMTGTIVINGDEVNYYPGFGDNDAFIGWIMGGGASRSFNMYRCSDGPCLSMTVSGSMTISKSSSLQAQVEANIDGLIRAIRNDTAPSAREMAMVRRTSIPVYRVLNVYAAYSGPIIDTQRQTLIEAVTLDLALLFIRDLVTEIRNRAESAPASGQDHMRLWSERLERLERSINGRQLEGTKSFDGALQLVERVQLIEAQLGSRFGGGFGEGTAFNRDISPGR